MTTGMEALQATGPTRTRVDDAYFGHDVAMAAWWPEDVAQGVRYEDYSSKGLSRDAAIDACAARLAEWRKEWLAKRTVDSHQ